MSNFADRLDELMDVAKSPTNEIEDWQCRLQDRQAAMQFLYNHAPAIRDLVRAAELINETFSPARDGMDYEVLPVGVLSIRQALAKLEEP